ncbi:LysR family transcriptional regulator [Pusillimonas sp. T7-7]|uniref:LysR substrate-binding domain-containing protein n=1 Tax=Pusillimonas sp. (strain T7-7) TaxID=1007105 RepID=UPI00020856D1|nr:LysR substrate-binding domain-containing protein [Pusillimonas sp. T7-7]AEC20838.1 LysR family transcriptional regulator [Pusillimonas sp. T7-7]
MKTPPLRRLPATSHLLSLESALRKGSITEAGKELCLTQSAISKQLSQLETHLGVQLVQRTPNGVLPTAAGKQYLEKITPLLIALEDATMALKTAPGRGQHLRLCVAPSFASFWLLPKLSRFQQQHPEILVHITTQTGIPDLTAAGFDVAIVNAIPIDQRYNRDTFLSVNAYAVYAPSLVPSIADKPLQAYDLASLPLLHQTTLPNAWLEYFDAAGIHTQDAVHGPRYSTLALGLQAAIAGLGCALLPDYVTEQPINEGQLRRVSHPAYQVPTPYSLVYARQQHDQPAITTFKDWLLREARQEATDKPFHSTRPGGVNVKPTPDSS